MRHGRTVGIAAIATTAIAAPSRAFAAESTPVVPDCLSAGMGAFALLAAIVLLIEVRRLGRIAAGAAFADNMVYVMGGIVCLATSVLVGWVTTVTDFGLDAGQARFFSDALVGMAMVLLGVYFVRVRRAMVRYLNVLSGDALLVRAHVGDEEAGSAEGDSGA